MIQYKTSPQNSVTYFISLRLVKVFGSWATRTTFILTCSCTLGVKAQVWPTTMHKCQNLGIRDEECQHEICTDCSKQNDETTHKASYTDRSSTSELLGNVVICPCPVLLGERTLPLKLLVYLFNYLIQ